MIDAEHLPHPENLPQMVIENNAMLQQVLNNQAFLLEMITATYQLLKYHSQKDPRPTDDFVREKARLATKKFNGYQENVAAMFEKLNRNMNAYAKESSGVSN